MLAAPAGAGKTTTLATAVARWVDRGALVTALAPSARAAAELEAATGARGQTVARWLAVQARHDGERFILGDPDQLSYRSVIVVDEASMLSTADLDQLTARAAAAKARVVLVGDPAQIGAVNAPGGMFEHLTARPGHPPHRPHRTAPVHRTRGRPQRRCGCATATRASWTSTPSTAGSTPRPRARTPRTRSSTGGATAPSRARTC